MSKYTLTYTSEGQPLIEIHQKQYNQLIQKVVSDIVRSGYQNNLDFVLIVGTGGFYCGAPIAKILKRPFGVVLARHYEESKGTVIDTIGQEVEFSLYVAAFADEMKKWKKILIVDDLDDSGDTFHEVEVDIRNRFGKKFEIRTCALWHKKSSKYMVDYIGDYIDYDHKTQKMPWIIQPHEVLIKDLRKKINLK